MAEVGDFPSVKDGSDADFEFPCTPCGEDNIREEAVKYCQECQEFLCATCTRHHGRQKVLRSHKLIDTNDAHHGSLVAKSTKCQFHGDRDIEMYCGSHDMVYCAKCIATEHRSCTGVVGIESVQTSFVQQNEVQRLQGETKNIQERLATADKKKQENLESLEEQRNAILDKVQDTERNLIEHICKLKTEATNSLDKHYALIRDELKSDIKGLDDTRKETEISKTNLEKVTSMDAGQQFIQMKLIQSTVANAKKLLENDEARGDKVLSFTENVDLKTAVITARAFGRAQTISGRSSAPRQYKVKSKKEINVKTQSDTTTCFISDVCQLQDGTIILADQNNKKIKRLDVDNNIRDHCNIDAEPTGICGTGQNEVAVKMNNNKIQFISVGTTLSISRNITIEGGGHWGVAYIDGNIWVSTGGGVNVYSTPGTLLKTITKGENGQNIFNYRSQHMAVNKDTVIVTYNSDGAVGVGRDGTVKQQYRDQRLASTVGACISNDGTVFLSGFSSCNIMMFSLDGKCLGELVAKDDGLTNPVSLYYDNKRNCLIVTCASSDTICLFMCH